MNDIATRWVIARHPWNGAQGKYVASLANEGIGYIFMNPQRSKTDDVIVAFRRAEVGSIPHHLSYATPQQSEMLEKKRLDRQGMNELVRK